MTPIVEAYFKLTKLMEDIDYYNKYPSRMYIREFIEREDTIEGKVRAMLRDSIIQREAIPNWMSLWYQVDNPFEYYMKLQSGDDIIN